jgi:hypothetical protein
MFGIAGLRTRSAVPVALLFLLGQGCIADPTQPDVPDSGAPVPVPPADGGAPPVDGGAPPPPPVLPPFLSADEPRYYSLGEEEEEEEEEEETVPGTMPVLEEEYAQYRILPDGMLVNLRSSRGLQIIDMSNAAQPVVVGRLSLDANPSQLLVTGNHAIVLANQRQRGKRVDVGLGIAEENVDMIFLVDLSDRTAPRVVDTLIYEGSGWDAILADRNGQPFLYMIRSVTRRFQNGDGSVRAQFLRMIDSYRISDDSLVAVAQLELPATTEYVRLQSDVVLVARLTPGLGQPSEISIIDISASDGSITQRGTVAVAGQVESPHHMDLRNGMLRAFSGPTLFEVASHLQIWNATNLDAPILVDEETFGVDGELYGTVLLEDRAFATTYDPASPVDPFHAFTIDGAGNITQRSEFVVPEWNDLFHPVLGDTRMIGVDIDAPDWNPELATVSLYDITDPANPSPLVARVEVSGEGVGNALASASWKYEALTVHENSVNVQAPTGEIETGLLLLPFESDWFENNRRHHQHGAQMFTFSSTTITRRGLVLHSPFRPRNFHSEVGNVVGNLSRTELTLSDLGDVDQPTELGRVELMPEYSDILSYGAYRVRLKDPRGLSLLYQLHQPLEAQVISSAEDANLALPVASFQLPFGSKIFKVGESLLAAVRTGADGLTRIRIYDLADPRQPRQTGQLDISAIPNLPTWSQRGEVRPAIHAVGNALVLLDQHAHDEVDETENTECRTTLTQEITCAGQVGCTYAAGEQTCFDDGEGTQFCEGGFARCTDHGNGDSTCEPRAADELEGVTPNTFCGPVARYRNWRQLELYVVDLTDPAAPTLRDSILMSPEHHAVSVLAHGSEFYVSTTVPFAAPADPRPHVAYYLTRIDLSEPAQPVVDPAISVPGELISVQGDTLLMRDAVWGQQFIETALAQIRIVGGHALLERYHRFVERSVGNVVADDTGLVAAKHGQVWGRPWYHAVGAFDDTLILMRMGPAPSPPGADVPGFDVLSENAVEHSPDPFLLAEQRLFLRHYDALQIIDVSNPALPVPRATFLTNGSFSNPLFENGELLLAAGTYGIVQIDLDTDNLLDATP